MPVYEFNCENCEESKELLLEMSQSGTQIKCESCDSDMKKKFNSVPIHFKGEGFYCTDYKDKESD